MLNIIDIPPSAFYSHLQGKRLYMFGAGSVASHFHDVFCKNYPVEAMIDNNRSLWKSQIELNGQHPVVISTSEFIRRVSKSKQSEILLFIAPVYQSMEIVAQLDAIKELDGLDTCLGLALRIYPCKPRPVPYRKEVMASSIRIPRKIHWCWFGGNPVPPHLQAYIDGWQQICPDYEIIRWDENNYDISKNRYMREAWEAKKMGFASDYARLDIVYNEGGMYLDTDVELLKRPDSLLHDSAFFVISFNDEINTGSGFGAEKKHPLIKELRDYYNTFTFNLGNGRYNARGCYRYQHPVLKKWGFKIENIYQNVNGVSVYPSNIVASYEWQVDDCTIGFHHGDLSWLGKEKKSNYRNFPDVLKERLSAQSACGKLVTGSGGTESPH